MKVLLLYNSFLPEIHWNCLKAQEKNMGSIPPINLGYVASIIRNSGHEVALIDLQVETYSHDQLVHEIHKISPTLLGFTITTYLFHPVLEWIKKVKESVRVPIIIGGFHMSLYPKQTMSHSVIDFGIIGNDPQTIRLFLDNYRNIKKYQMINGLCYRNAGEVFINNFHELQMVNLESLPFPARDLLHNEKYGNILSQRKNFTAVLTGVGCSFGCKYCASTLTQCLLRTPENVGQELEECYHEYGIREIDFYDQSFTIDRKRAIKICNEILMRNLNISWTIRTRTDLVDEELLILMKRAGLRRIMYGIESGNQHVLDQLNKKEDISHIKEVVCLTKRCGIEILGFFMFGCPGETKKTLNETKRFILSLPLDDVQITRFTLFPGTTLYDEYRSSQKETDYWAEYILDRNTVKRLPLFLTQFSPEYIEKEIQKMYLCFYLRPHVIIKKMLHSNILKNGKKYLMSLIDMVLNNK